MTWIIDGSTTLLYLETGAYITIDGKTWHHHVPSDADCGAAINGPAALAALGHRWDGQSIVPAASITAPVTAAPKPELVPVDLSQPVTNEGAYLVQFDKDLNNGDGNAWHMAAGDSWADHTHSNARFRVIAAWRIVWIG